MGPSRSSSSPARYRSGTILLCILRESTSFRATPPAVTSALPKPSVPVIGSLSRLTLAPAGPAPPYCRAAALRSAGQPRQRHSNSAIRRGTFPQARRPVVFCPTPPTSTRSRLSNAPPPPSGAGPFPASTPSLPGWPLTARLTSRVTGPDRPKWANSSEPRRARPGRLAFQHADGHVRAASRRAAPPPMPRHRHRHQGRPRRHDGMAAAAARV